MCRGPRKLVTLLAACCLSAGSSARAAWAGEAFAPGASPGPKPRAAAATRATYSAPDPAPVPGLRSRNVRASHDDGYRYALRSPRATSPRAAERTARAKSVLRQGPVADADEGYPPPPVGDAPAGPGAPVPEEVPAGEPEPMQLDAPPRGPADDWSAPWPADGWEAEGDWSDPAWEPEEAENWEECGYVRPAELWAWENFSASVGVHGFKAPTDRDVNGNFGFHEGVNWGIPFWDRFGVGAQVGVQVAHSDLAGGESFDDSRTQTFFTAGLFHRPIRGCGWQGGAVIDYLHDDFFVSMDVGQLRAELSYCGRQWHELGFWTAQQLNNDTAELNGQLELTWETTDLYALFYRYRFTEATTARFWGGATGDGDGLIGGEASAALTDCWSLMAAFNYRIPDQLAAEEEQVGSDSERENFALSIHLVWTPGRRNPRSHLNPYRPLFSVADNTTLLLDLVD